MKVKVYFNLHKKVFSVVAMEGEHKGLVIDHTDYIELSSAEFKVQKKGRERVLKEKRKNVHAYIMGYDCRLKDDSELTFNWVRAKYNPYLNSTFVLEDDEDRQLRYSQFVRLKVVNDRGVIMVSDDLL